MNSPTLKYMWRKMAWITALTMVITSTGLYKSTLIVGAGTLDAVSDTLSDSAPSALANHTIQYTNAITTTAGQTIQLTFDPTGSQFGGVDTVTTSSISFSGATLVDTCSAGSDRVTLSTTTNQVIFTVCASNTVSAGSKTITITNKITNPTSTGSYTINIGGNQTNNANLSVAIVNHIILTASVDTTLTFSVGSVATGTTINGVTTTFASTATALNFGTLPINSPITIGQQLSLTTNAVNGFAVTVREDQNLQSSNGADIDLFANGQATATPAPWSSPSSTVGQENTWGHIGVTSDDADLNSGEFTGSKFAGNFQATSSRTVFSATSSADGTTQNIGTAMVAYRVEIGVLQEAGTDYTNTLTYVATPIF